MKILILEGIATSGKSSIVEKLSMFLSKDKLVVYGEPATHEPIMKESNGLHIEFFKSLIINATKQNADLVIFDRFHFTQAHRANSGIASYAEIEDLLVTQETLVVYLEVEENAIAERVKRAVEHRDQEWGDYVLTKGKTFDEIASYYIKQQGSQLRLLAESKLPSIVFNSTQHDYDVIAASIINDWYNKKA